MLRAAYGRGELEFQGDLSRLRRRASFASLLDRLSEMSWVVYSKPPFGGPVQVLKYLARYTHRVAIGNRRILAVDGSGVTFRWRDRSTCDRPRTMQLPGVEFLRRFPMHVLPRGFQRLRHYGLLGNRMRESKLAMCRLLLGAEMPAPVDDVAPYEVADEWCPECQVGRLVRQPWSAMRTPEVVDTS